MKTYFYILLFINISNCVAMQQAALEGYRKRAGVASTNHCKPVPPKTVQAKLSQELENQLMGYVFVPITTFVAAAAVFNVYKDF